MTGFATEVVPVVLDEFPDCAPVPVVPEELSGPIAVVPEFPADGP